MEAFSQSMPGGDVDLGSVVLRPERRAISGPDGAAQVEPLVMRLLQTLARRAGRMVSRSDIFEACWPGGSVGDDSLNRLVASARRALKVAGDRRVEIRTVPSAGYVLDLRPVPDAGGNRAGEAAQALRAGFLSWRAAFPEADFVTIERLRRVVEADSANAAAWGMLALLYRHATEYGLLAERAEMVQLCEQAAARAIELQGDQPEARVALVSVAPLYRNWRAAHRELSAVLEMHPGHVIAAHDLSIAEMATGRARQAKRLVDPLVAGDPLAPCFGYKSTYQHWSLGDLETMDQRADQAIQLWPHHPAVWTARFWTLAHTGRPAAAMAMIAPGTRRPAMSEPVAGFARRLLLWKIDGSGDRAGLIRHAVDAVAAGPVQAINSLMALGLLGDIDAGFDVAEAYYLQQGRLAVPSHGEGELPLNEQRRRVTQQLFTPACAGMRADPRMTSLLERMGLIRYWEETGRGPEVPVYGFSS